MRKRLTYMALGALMGVTASAVTATAADTITIGVATAQTGALAPFDGPVIEGFKIAVDEINAKGGIDGKIMIKTIDKDVRSDPAQTSIATQELVEAKVNVLVLPCDADPAFAAAAIADKAKIPGFSTCASSPTLPLMGGDYMFANFPGDNVQATVSAKWAHDAGPSLGLYPLFAGHPVHDPAALFRRRLREARRQDARQVDLQARAAGLLRRGHQDQGAEPAARRGHDIGLRARFSRPLSSSCGQRA